MGANNPTRYLLAALGGAFCFELALAGVMVFVPTKGAVMGAPLPLGTVSWSLLGGGSTEPFAEVFMILNTVLTAVPFWLAAWRWGFPALGAGLAGLAVGLVIELAGFANLPRTGPGVAGFPVPLNDYDGRSVYPISLWLDCMLIGLGCVAVWVLARPVRRSRGGL
jgi:hypothetical protein